MQKRPLAQYVPYMLSTKFPLVATPGNCLLYPDDSKATLSFHDCIEFVYCHSGKGMLVSESHFFPFKSGDVIFISPYMPHYLHKEGNDDCRCEAIHVNLTQMYDPAIFPDIIEFTQQLLVPFTIHPIISGELYPNFRKIILLILNELSQHRPYFEMSIKGYCFSIVSLLRLMRQNLPDSFSPESQKTNLYPALLHMNRYYSQNITIPELASLCGLSETHFRRLFKCMFAMSPFDYLTHIRIRESCILLSRHPLLISQVAEQVGFRTLSSYNRKFRDIMGIPPSQWVKCGLYKSKNPHIIQPDQPAKRT